MRHRQDRWIGPASSRQQSMRELFGVEFVAGVSDHAPAAQADASLGGGAEMCAPGPQQFS
jgi:hypothetical protein